MHTAEAYHGHITCGNPPETFVTDADDVFDPVELIEMDRGTLSEWGKFVKDWIVDAGDLRDKAMDWSIELQKQVVFFDVPYVLTNAMAEDDVELLPTEILARLFLDKTIEASVTPAAKRAREDDVDNAAPSTMLQVYNPPPRPVDTHRAAAEDEDMALSILAPVKEGHELDTAQVLTPTSGATSALDQLNLV